MECLVSQTGTRLRCRNHARGAGNFGGSQLRGAWVGPARVLVGQDGSEVSAFQTRVPQIGSTQICTMEVSATQVGLLQMGTTKYRPRHMSVSEVGLSEIGVGQVGALEEGIWQPR